MFDVRTKNVADNFYLTGNPKIEKRSLTWSKNRCCSAQAMVNIYDPWSESMNPRWSSNWQIEIVVKKEQSKQWLWKMVLVDSYTMGIPSVAYWHSISHVVGRRQSSWVAKWVDQLLDAGGRKWIMIDNQSGAPGAPGGHQGGVTRKDWSQLRAANEVANFAEWPACAWGEDEWCCDAARMESPQRFESWTALLVSKRRGGDDDRFVWETVWLFQK